MLSLRRVVVNVHLFVGAEFGNHLVQELLVDVVVQVLDGHLHFGRLADVVLVDLEENEM